LRNKFLNEHGEYCDECKINQAKFKEQDKKRIENLKKEIQGKYRKEIEAEKFRLLAETEKRFIEEIRKIEDMDSFGFNILLRDIEGLNYDAFNEKYIGFEVDHKIAIMNGGDGWDKSNLQVLCSNCHRKKTKLDRLK